VTAEEAERNHEGDGVFRRRPGRGAVWKRSLPRSRPGGRCRGPLSEGTAKGEDDRPTGSRTRGWG